ncbi:MAG: hypothetical protein A2X35_10625 [Elusimicrobia bacterium GWA2_61_42]|nr:MAG: hypothetical protein A2X35_10625 [Elusimicrobia bacterium GWA2_61_42]OGR74715.1 MAG: hypothetical protein A2X38_02590 [Elusimicrobia bacterium GWC2_61_25]
MEKTGIDILLVSESDHFLPAADLRAGANAFSPVYEYLNKPLADLGLPFQYTLNSPQRCPLAVLAGYLSGAGFSCAIADNIFRDGEEAKRFEALLAGRPAVVGISSSSLHLTESAAAIAATVRRLSPSSVIALGGCGLNFNGGLAACADVVVQGDGELALEELLKAVKSGTQAKDLPRVLASARKGQDGILRLDGRRNLGLDYLPAWPLYSSLPSSCFPVEASKGCAHSCVFCSYPERGNQEYRPVGSVIRELNFLVRELGARYLRFVDTNLTSDPAYVEELCRLLVREKLQVPWSCFARVDELAARPELCARMADAGCFWIYGGAESADGGILAGMKKGFGPADILKGVNNVKAAGMAFHGNFVVGFPGETAATLARARELIASSGMDTVSFTVLGLTAPLSAQAERNPQAFAGLARHENHWKHATMDFDEARIAAAALIRALALKDGAPVIASHGIAMYYLLGGGLDFSEVLAYFSAVRDYHRAAGTAGAAAAARAAGTIRTLYARTAANFGWRGEAGSPAKKDRLHDEH